jgi:hypothetical protein
MSSLAVLAAVLGAASAVRAQDSNVTLPVDTIERLLRFEEYEMMSCRDTRFEADRTQLVTLMFPGERMIRVKWARAEKGADTFNNRPRFELAAYEIQKLFLDEEDYVVPPTVARGTSPETCPTAGVQVGPTFDRSSDVLVLMSYWLGYVTPNNVYDTDRFDSDSAYARHLGDFNVLTYLIRHADMNPGNFLVSTDSANPRVFAVDNGVAFGDESDRGDAWRDIRVDRLPQGTVDRLQDIGKEDLERALGVIVQYEIREGRLVDVEPTENLDRRKGVRQKDDIIQLGLTGGEINAIYGRLERLLRRVDSGEIETF